MSFILDALKKSENERQRQVGPSLADVRVVRRNNERPWWVVAVAALLVVNLGVLLFVLLRDRGDRPAAAAVQPAPQQNYPQQNYYGPAPAQPAPQQSYNPAPGYNGPNYAQANGQYYGPNNAPNYGQPAQQYQQPPAQNHVTPTGDPSVRSLADEANRYDDPYGDESVNRNLAGAANVPAGPPIVRQIQPPAVAPLPSAVFEAKTAANAGNSGGALVGEETLPTLDDLTASGTNLPELHLDIHVSSQNPAERFVFVNMRKYLEGDTLKEGPSVERITPEGVILNQRGLRFLLPRQ